MDSTSCETVNVHQTAACDAGDIKLPQVALYDELTRNRNALCYRDRFNSYSDSQWAVNVDTWTQQWEALSVIDASKLVREIAMESTAFILLTLDLDDEPSPYLYPFQARKLYSKGVVPVTSFLGVPDDYTSSASHHIGKEMDLAWLKEPNTRIVISCNKSIDSPALMFGTLLKRTRRAHALPASVKMHKYAPYRCGYCKLLVAIEALFVYAQRTCTVAEDVDPPSCRVFRLARAASSVAPLLTSRDAPAQHDELLHEPIAKRTRRSLLNRSSKTFVYGWMCFARDFPSFLPSTEKASLFNRTAPPAALLSRVHDMWERSYYNKCSAEQLDWSRDVHVSLKMDIASHDSGILAVMIAIGFWRSEIVAYERALVGEGADVLARGEDLSERALAAALLEVLPAASVDTTVLVLRLCMRHVRDGQSSHTSIATNELINMLVALAEDRHASETSAAEAAADNCLPELEDKRLLRSCVQFIRRTITNASSYIDRMMADDIFLSHVCKVHTFPIWICSHADVTCARKRNQLFGELLRVTDVLNVCETRDSWSSFLRANDSAAYKDANEPTCSTNEWAPSHYLALYTVDGSGFMDDVLKDEKLSRIVDFIEEAVRHDRRIVVHCLAGQHRSVACVMLWMLVKRRMSVSTIVPLMLKLNRNVALMPRTVMWMKQYAAQHHIESGSMVHVACSPFNRKDSDAVQQVFDSARAIEAARESFFH